LLPIAGRKARIINALLRCLLLRVSGKSSLPFVSLSCGLPTSQVKMGSRGETAAKLSGILTASRLAAKSRAESIINEAIVDSIRRKIFRFDIISVGCRF
jgi:hypothetical protein